LIFDKIKEFYSKNMPFTVYRKPNSRIVSGFFMRDDDLCYTTDFTENGFVFAPFDSEEKAVLFPVKKATFLTEKLSTENTYSLKNNFIPDDASKEKHIQLVAKAITLIAKGLLQKVVISREEMIKIERLDVLEIYQKLLQTYSNAFVYVWFHPKVGLWFGATPETLLEIKGTKFTTMSLAGTQVFKDAEDVVWKTKELEEQQLVTVFIENQLKKIANNLKIDTIETIKAGSLLHLKTTVSGEINSQQLPLKSLIRALHPTPAVCGFPREKAKEFILENESYTRSFYTGFLGELNIQASPSSIPMSNLFVNLRCMNIENNFANIYIGGGITKSSNSFKEWEETVAKSRTMKKIL
jgi:isochorismate synthase